MYVKRGIKPDYVGSYVVNLNGSYNLVNCWSKMKFLDITDILIKIFLIIFGLFILYQIILKIFGGSWMTESLIIALLMLNIGLTFTNSIKIAKNNSDFNHLSNQFKCLANDFKLHTKYK